MSKYFEYFPKVNYKFGDEVGSVAFDNLSVYVDVFDRLQDIVTSYNYINILDGDRPDTLSYKLYGTGDYHWTFFYMNNHLRESGWPLSYQDAYEHSLEFYPNWYVRTKTPFHLAGNHTFRVGQTVTGRISGTVGTVVRKDPDVGQVIISATDNFNEGELIYYTPDDGVDIELLVHAQGREYNGIHHIENSSGEWVDIDPSTQSIGVNTIVTFQDHLINTNEANKKIKIIAPDQIGSVISAFRKYVS